MRSLICASALGLAFLAAPITPGRLAAQAAVAEVQVTPDTVTLRPGERRPVFATAYDRQGHLVAATTFTFRSADSTVARVGRDGVILGVTPGSTSVEARAGSRRAVVRVRVAPETAPARPSPTVLAIEPPSSRLLPSEALRLVARTLRADGTPAEPVAVTWQSLAPGVARVDSQGLVVGVARGQAVIRADGPAGLAATALVAVDTAAFALSRDRLVLAPDGGTDTLRAVVPAHEGRELRTGLVWRSTDTTVVRVGPTGVVVGVRPGEAEVVAEGYFQERRARVRVHRVPAVLVLRPQGGTPLVLAPNGSREVYARAEAADSTPIAEAQIQWRVADTSVAVYDRAAGRLVARGLGTTTLTARLTGFDPVVWPVEVVPGRLVLDRERLGVEVGRAVALRPMLVDGGGRLVGTAGGVRWRSTRPEVIAVDSLGTVRAAALGRALLVATAPWGQADTVEAFGIAGLLVVAERDGRRTIAGLAPERPGALVPVFADTAGGAAATVAQPVYSPDRTRIAYASNRGGSWGIWVMDADGANARRITAGPGPDTEPAWLPDGERLVYVSAASGTPQLHLIGRDGRGMRPLTTDARAKVSPAVSPDGRTIVFVGGRGTQQDLWRAELVDGALRGEPVRLAATDRREASPIWLAEGELAWIEQRDGGRSRIVRGTIGAPAGEAAEPRLIAELDGLATGLAASRDGATLAYLVRRPRGRGAASAPVLHLQPAAPGAPARAVALGAGILLHDPSF